MPYALKAFRILLPLTLIVVGVLWMLGREREITVEVPAAPEEKDAGFYSSERNIPPENNLTQRIAESIADELILKNQNGPSETEEGLSLALNPAEALTAMVASIEQIPQQPFKGIALAELRISERDSLEDRRAYFENLQTILSRTLDYATPQPTVLEAFESALAQDSSALVAMIKQHDDAISALRAMPVPASLAALHKKEIDLLMKANIMLKGMAAISIDQLRAYLAFQIYPALVEETQNLQQEFTRTAERELLGMSVWERIFGSKIVYAAVPTVELNKLLLSIFPRDKYEHLLRILNELLKGNILNYLRDQVLQFVRGQAGGECPLSTYFSPTGRSFCPKFVLNWEQMLFGAQKAADARLATEIEQSRISERNKQVLIQQTQRQSADGRYGETFDTMTQGAQRCEEGGDPVAEMLCWTDIENSFEMQYVLSLQRKEELRKKYEEARKAESIATQGFESTKKCVRYEETLDARRQPVCIEWVTTEPGVITKEITAKTATVDWDRIVNSFDLNSLLAALASMLINQFLDAGIEGILGLIESGIVPSPIPVPSPPDPTADPISMQLTADPIVVTGPGSASQLTWRSQNADSCTASGGWSGTKTAIGSETVFPNNTTTYTLTCSNAFGESANHSVTIVVSLLSEISISLDASPDLITRGQSSTLSWNANIAPGPVFSCQASGAWSGSRPLSGNEVVSPTITSAYNLTCRSLVGDTGTQSATITVR